MGTIEKPVVLNIEEGLKVISVLQNPESTTSIILTLPTYITDIAEVRIFVAGINEDNHYFIYKEMNSFSFPNEEEATTFIEKLPTLTAIDIIAMMGPIAEIDYDQPVS
ncbi:hypothetical protein [Alteribacter populi]|uniref:hypothetical protein n=1 Tax=Alteribacter populi TaxID=2011011 RepID=UPI0012FF6E77|nr:hypothetical protein [Alteribacter populi]